MGKKMNGFKKLLASAALAGSTIFGAQAAVHDIPEAGLTQTFSWFGSVTAVDSFSITVGSASYINVVLTDLLVPGDEFGLTLDSNAVNWTSSGYIDGSFVGTANNILLGAGTHLFEIHLTAMAPGLNSGSGSAAFSAISAVPEPATGGMLMAGLGLLVYAVRRKRA